MFIDGSVGYNKFLKNPNKKKLNNSRHEYKHDIKLCSVAYVLLIWTVQRCMYGRLRKVKFHSIFNFESKKDPPIIELIELSTKTKKTSFNCRFDKRIKIFEKEG